MPGCEVALEFVEVALARRAAHPVGVEAELCPFEPPVEAPAAALVGERRIDKIVPEPERSHESGRKADEVGRGRESVDSNRCTCGRQGDAGEGDAEAECVVADEGKVGWEHDALEGRAAVERTVANGWEVRGKDKVRQG